MLVTVLRVILPRPISYAHLFLKYSASSSALASRRFAPLLLVVLIVTYLPFSSLFFLPRWYLAQGCIVIHCGSTMRNFQRRDLRNISRSCRVFQIIDYSNRFIVVYYRRLFIYFITDNFFCFIAKFRNAFINLTKKLCFQQINEVLNILLIIYILIN